MTSPAGNDSKASWRPGTLRRSPAGLARQRNPPRRLPNPRPRPRRRIHPTARRRPPGPDLPPGGQPTRPSRRPLVHPDRGPASAPGCRTDPPKQSTISPERIKRIGFGFRNFTNYRIRALLYAGKPNWDLLPSVTPPEIRRATLVSRTQRRAAESSTTQGQKPAAATNIRIWSRLAQPRAFFHPPPPFEPPHSRPPPPSRTRKSSAPPPAAPGPSPASTESTARASRPWSGAGARPAKVPIMTAAHSGTPAAVFVCQHTHSTANLRQTQYPHPGTRKIFFALLAAAGLYMEAQEMHC